MIKNKVALIGSSFVHPTWKEKVCTIIKEEVQYSYFEVLLPKVPPPYDFLVPTFHLLRAHELSLAQQADVTVWHHPPPELWSDALSRFVDTLLERSKLLITWIPPEQEEKVDEESLYKRPTLIPYKGPLEGLVPLIEYFANSYSSDMYFNRLMLDAEKRRKKEKQNEESANPTDHPECSGQGGAEQTTAEHSESPSTSGDENPIQG